MSNEILETIAALETLITVTQQSNPQLAKAFEQIVLYLHQINEETTDAIKNTKNLDDSLDFFPELLSTLKQVGDFFASITSITTGIKELQTIGSFTAKSFA